MIYLASPYSNLDPYVREERYIRAMSGLGYLLHQKKWAYSPIVHCHEIKKVASLPPGHEFWLDFDREMIKRCDKVTVLRIGGWEQSKGVAAEIAFAEEQGIPVDYL